MSRDRTPRKWNGETAQLYGCIVSFEGDDGAELTLHRTGPLRAALRSACAEAVAAELRSACAEAVAADPSLRVVAYSTPQTIYVDLAGGRLDFDGPSGHRIAAQSPEVATLAGVGLGHMAHPRLRLGASENDARRQRRARVQP